MTKAHEETIRIVKRASLELRKEPEFDWIPEGGINLTIEYHNGNVDVSKIDYDRLKERYMFARTFGETITQYLTMPIVKDGIETQSQRREFRHALERRGIRDMLDLHQINALRGNNIASQLSIIDGFYEEVGKEEISRYESGLIELITQLRTVRDAMDKTRGRAYDGLPLEQKIGLVRNIRKVGESILGFYIHESLAENV